MKRKHHKMKRNHKRKKPSFKLWADEVYRSSQNPNQQQRGHPPRRPQQQPNLLQPSPSEVDFTVRITRSEVEDDFLPADETLVSKTKSTTSAAPTSESPPSANEQAAAARGPAIHLVLDESFTQPRKQFKNDGNFQHLPNGDCGDGIPNPHPKDEVPDKHWAQRRRYFTKYDEGIKMDKEGWYSVTPEAIANHHAKRLVASRSGLVVLDAFAGVGGNAVQFARNDNVALVICVDLDLDRLKLAANNCRVYAIPKEKLLFVNANALDVLRAYRHGEKILTETEAGQTGDAENENDAKIDSDYSFVTINKLPSKIDAVFLSPPWGGSDYCEQKEVDIKDIKLDEQTNGEDLLRLARDAVPSSTNGHHNILYFLPKNSNGVKIAESAIRVGFRGEMELEQNVLNDKFKTVTVYL